MTKADGLRHGTDTRNYGQGAAFAYADRQRFAGIEVRHRRAHAGKAAIRVALKNHEGNSVEASGDNPARRRLLEQ